MCVCVCVCVCMCVCVFVCVCVCVLVCCSDKWSTSGDNSLACRHSLNIVLRYIYACVCMCVCACVCVCVCLVASMIVLRCSYKDTYVCKSMYVCVWEHVDVYVASRSTHCTVVLYIYTYICKCVYVCMWVGCCVCVSPLGTL